MRLLKCKVGGQAAFIDAEHALDPTYASKLGVNIDELLLSQPDTGEQALKLQKHLCAVVLLTLSLLTLLLPWYQKLRSKAKWGFPRWFASTSDVSGVA